MKLELKHLAPYLPYELKVKTKIGNLILCQLNNSTKWNAWFYFCRNSKNKNQLYNFNNLKNADGIGRGFLLKEITPILRPISDLTKEIEVNGEKFYPLELIGKIIDNEYVGLAEDEDGIIIGKDVSPRCGCPYDCDCMSYTYNLFYKDFNFYSTVYQDGNPNDMVDEIVHESYLLMQKLIEWHFDVFELIEKGLAIDINTLK